MLSRVRYDSHSDHGLCIYAYSSVTASRKEHHQKRVSLMLSQSLHNSLILPFVGLRIDAQTGLDYLTTHPTFKNTPIVRRKFIARIMLNHLSHFQILYGQSIGGAVSIDLASRNPDKVCPFFKIFTGNNKFFNLELDISACPREHIYLSA